MIIDYKSMSLFDKPVFTWVHAQTPMRGSVPLPPDACFAYILDGDKQILTFDGEVKAEPGQVILSLCGTSVGRMLATRSKGKMETLVVHFHNDVLKRVYHNSKPPLWEENEKPVVKTYVQMAASELIESYFRSLLPFFTNQIAVNEDILELKLKEIILLLMRTDSSDQIKEIMNKLFSERTFNFKQIVEAHITEPLTIDELAIKINVSLSSFKRMFKKVYRKAPHKYIMERRLEKVAHLLSASNEPIQLIGFNCGFNSATHLSQSFKKKYGVSPSEYRSNPDEIIKNME